MDTLDTTSSLPTQKSNLPVLYQGLAGASPPDEWEWILRSKKIQLARYANYYKALHKKAKLKIEELKQELVRRDAKIRGLEQRLYGKRTEKTSTQKSEAAPTVKPQ